MLAPFSGHSIRNVRLKIYALSHDTKRNVRNSSRGGAKRKSPAVFIAAKHHSFSTFGETGFTTRQAAAETCNVTAQKADTDDHEADLCITACVANTALLSAVKSGVGVVKDYLAAESSEIVDNESGNLHVDTNAVGFVHTHPLNVIGDIQHALYASKDTNDATFDA